MSSWDDVANFGASQSSGGWDDVVQFGPSPKAAPKPEQKKPEAPPPTLLEAGWEGLKGDVRTGAARVASGLGWDDTSKYIQEQARKNYEEQARRPIKDLDEDFWGGLYEQSVASAPSMAPVMAGSMAGAATGTALAGPIGTLAGGIIGGTAAAIPQFIGSNLKRQVEEQKVPLEQTNLATASGTAVVQSAFDSLLGGGLFGGLFKVPAAVAKNVVSRVATKMIEGGVTEALTEGAQQWLEILQANPEKARSMPPEVRKEIRDAMIVGGFMGGAVGGVSGIPKEKEASTPKADEPMGPPSPDPRMLDPQFDYPAGGGPAQRYDYPRDVDYPGPGEPPADWNPRTPPPPPGTPPGQNPVVWNNNNPDPNQPKNDQYSDKEVQDYLDSQEHKAEEEWLPNGTGQPYRKEYPEADFPEMRHGAGFPNINLPNLGDSPARVFQDVKAKLIAAGLPEIEANANASIYQQIYKVMSQRTGIDAFDLYKAANMDVEGPAQFKGPKQPGPKTPLLKRVQDLEKKGMSRRDAMIKAADEMNVPFKDLEQGQITSLNQDEKSGSQDVRYLTGDDFHYSALQSALMRMPMKNATGQQVKNYLLKQGVKAEELEWSGIGDVLDRNANEKHDPQDLLLHYRDMSPRIAVQRPGSNQFPAQWPEYTLNAEGLKPEANYREVILKMPAIDHYSGGHWRKHQNAMAHYRTTDRVTNNNEPILFVEEFQSDLHQQARKVGYAGTIAQIDAVNAEMDEVYKKLVTALKDRFPENDVDALARSFVEMGPSLAKDRKEAMAATAAKTMNPDFSDHLAKIWSLQDKRRKLQSSIPNAPFKDTWPNLMFRYALKDALDSNKDYLAWPTGELEAKIQGHADEDRVNAHKKFMDERIKNYAEKLGKPYGAKPIKVTLGGNRPRQLLTYWRDGTTLTVYDDAPDGGQKVFDLASAPARTEIRELYGTPFLNTALHAGIRPTRWDSHELTYGNRTRVQWQDILTDLEEEAEELRNQYGVDYDSTGSSIRRNLDQLGIPESQADEIFGKLSDIALGVMEAKNAIEIINEKEADARGNNQKVWALPITEQMRELVLNGGLPLYQLKDNEKGTQTPRANISWLADKNLIRLFKSRDASSFMHESMHLWLEQMIKMAPYSREIAQDLNDLRVWTGNKGGPFTRDQHEMIARGFEKFLRSGKAPTNALTEVFKKFAEWLKQIYRKASDLKIEVPPHIERVYARMLTDVPAVNERSTPNDITVRPAADNSNAKTTLPQNNNQDPIRGRRVPGRIPMTPIGDPRIQQITQRMNEIVTNFNNSNPSLAGGRVGTPEGTAKLAAFRNTPEGREYQQLNKVRNDLIKKTGGGYVWHYNYDHGRPLLPTGRPDYSNLPVQYAGAKSPRFPRGPRPINRTNAVETQTNPGDDFDGGSLNQSPIGDEGAGENNPRNSRIAQNPIQRGLGWFQRVFNPFSQLEDADAYRDLRNLASGGVYAATQAAAKAKKALGGLNPADREAVNRYMETPNANPLDLPQAVREEAVKLKQYINGPLKNQLVKNKLLSEAAAKSYDDAYLPRLYLKYLLEGEGNVKGARMNLQYRKHRSDKTEDELLAMGEVRDPSVRAFYGIFRPMRDLAMMKFMTQIASTTGKNWVLPKSLVEWDGQKVTPHWLKAEAEAIRTVRSKAETDPDRVKAMLDVAQRMEDTATTALDELGMTDYDPKNYAEIPNTRQFGPMRGMIVRKEIADDITGAVNFVQPNNWFDKWFGDRQSVATKAISLWKFAKVPLNPPSQVRNIVSNMVLLNLSGVRIDRVVPLMVAAARDMRADGKYFQIAKKYGVGVGTFSEQELYAITDELNKIEMNNLGSGLAGWRAIYKAMLKGGKKVGDIYQIMEVWGKVAKIKHAMEKEGLSEAAAVREANKWLFDYSEVPQGVRRARQSPIGYPFMTFTYKVIPLMAEVVRRHPTRLLPYVAMSYVAPAMVAAMNDIDQDDPEKLAKSLTPALRRRNDMYLLPYKDKDNRWQFADVGYFLPWQMPLDAIRYLYRAGKASLSGDQREALGQLQEAGAATNILSNPLFNAVTAATTGIDPFSDKPIMDKRDPPRKQVMDLMSYIGGLALPTMFSPFGALGMALGSETGTGLNRYGEPGVTGGQMAARALGVNVYPVIPEAQRARNIQQMQREIQDIRTRMTFSLKDQSLTPDQRRRLVADFTDTIKDRVAQLQKYVKESEPSPRLRAASTVH